MSSYKFCFMILLTVSGCVEVAAESTTEKKLQDPTKPLAFTLTQPEKNVIANFTLSEIRIADGKRQVVINGKRLKKGDSIGGYLIKKIELGYVIIANEKGTRRLNLFSNRIIRKQL